MKIKLHDGSYLIWSIEDNVIFTQPNENVIPITTDPDVEFDDMFITISKQAEQINQLEKYIRELKGC